MTFVTGEEKRGDQENPEHEDVPKLPEEDPNIVSYAEIKIAESES